jgi:hypothetical protein
VGNPLPDLWAVAREHVRDELGSGQTCDRLLPAWESFNPVRLRTETETFKAWVARSGLEEDEGYRTVVSRAALILEAEAVFFTLPQSLAGRI